MNKIEKKTDNEIILSMDERIHFSGKPFTSVDIRETEKYDDEFGSLRMYRSHIGDSEKNENGFTLQIRAFQPLKDGNKPRNIIASISLSDSDVMELANLVIRSRKEFDTISKTKLEL
jgi:hypothetical protein